MRITFLQQIKYFNLLLIGVMLCLSQLGFTTSFSEGELIVKLKSEPRRNSLDQVMRTGVNTVDAMIMSHDLEIITPFLPFENEFSSLKKIICLKSQNGHVLDSLETVFSRSHEIEWVTRNYHYRTEFVPNDSLLNQEWWLEKISAESAWDISKGDSAVIIGIIDTGVDYLHSDLQSKIWVNRADANSNGIDDDNNGFIDDSIGWDFVDSPSLPSGGDHLIRDRDPMDELGHGTYVGGVAAAATNNQNCFASLGFDCKLMCLRAGNINGYLEEDDIVAAIFYGVSNGAKVINMSFGDVVASPLLREAVQIAYGEGVALIGSAGNNFSDRIHYPSGFSEVISVGATDQFDFKASFSNFGPSVDVMAPGVQILSTMLGGECGEWIFSNGTSYAAPMVAALSGLILSVNPTLSPSSIYQLIQSTADDIGRPGWDAETAHGRINARRALENAQFGSNVVAQIVNPRNDSGFNQNFSVYGDAWGADFDHWKLSYGIGENPSAWTVVNQGAVRVYNDLLGQIAIPVQDTVIVLKLETVGISGIYSIDHTHIYVQHSNPQIDTLIVRSMLDRDTYGDLIQVETDQVTNATLILTNSNNDSLREDFGYVADSHTALLSQANYAGSWQVQVKVQNLSGLDTWASPFDFALTTLPLTPNLWTNSRTSLPNGYLSPFTTDFDSDNRYEVWLAPIDGDGILHPLEVFEWNGLDFQSDSSFYGIHLPQDYGDADGDGLMEMMARRFDETRIWEQSTANGVPNNVIFEDTTNFIGAGFVDLDSTDGHSEIIARMNTSIDQLSRSRYVIFSVNSAYELSVIDTLPNESAGNNDLGPPKVLVGDLDNDNLTDFVYGDYEGDLIFCELENNIILQQWSYRFPMNDASTWYTSGDFDGDGQKELIAGCRSNSLGGSESQIRGRHWEYFIFENISDNNFTVVDSIFILGNENTVDHPASVNAADVNGDDADDILISAFPDQYIINFDESAQRYKVRNYYSPSQSNVCLSLDLDHDGANDFLYSDGEYFHRVETVAGSNQSPSPPYGLSGQPLSSTSIQLTWNSVANADSYRVFRSAQSSEFVWISMAVDTNTVLQDVTENISYTYAVASVNQAFPQNISPLSNYVDVVANSAPTLDDTAEFIFPHFVKITFSEPMGESALRQGSYQLDDSRMPAVVLSEEGGRVIVLSFDGEFSDRWYELSVRSIRDAQNSLLPNDERLALFNVNTIIVTAPQILSHQILGGAIAHSVEITFSLPMSASAVDPENYSIDSPRRVVSVEAAESDRSKIKVNLDPEYPIGSIGLPARLELRNIASQTGVALDTTNGQADILLGGSASNLDEAYVFPNPYKGIGPNGESGVYFAALPDKATIRIFTIQGRLIKKLSHENASGATYWNLKNEDENIVASGVYLFTIETDSQTKTGKLAVLR